MSKPMTCLICNLAWKLGKMTISMHTGTQVDPLLFVTAYELNEVHQSHVDPLLLATAQDQAHPIYGITANMLAVFHETSDVPGSQLCTLKASFWDELFLVT